MKVKYKSVPNNAVLTRFFKFAQKTTIVKNIEIQKLLLVFKKKKKTIYIVQLPKKLIKIYCVQA